MSRVAKRDVKRARENGIFDAVNSMPSEKRVIVIFDPNQEAENAELRDDLLKDAENLAKNPKKEVHAIRTEGDETGVTESAIIFCPEQFTYTEIARLMRNWHNRFREAQISYV